MSDKPLPAPARRPAVARVHGARPTGVREELEEIEARGALLVGLGQFARQTPSWLVSMLFHMAVLLVLALWMMCWTTFPRWKLCRRCRRSASRR